MSFYLDTSAILPSLVEEPTSRAISAFLLGAESDLLVSDFAATEVAAVLSRMVRMGNTAPDTALARLAEFDTWRTTAAISIEIHAADARLAYSFLRRFELKLHAPDALHLAIARRLDAILVTLDRPLARAATALGIAVEMPA